MTAGVPSDSNTIVLTADGGAATSSHTIIYTASIILIMIGVALLAATGNSGGAYPAGFGLLMLIVALVIPTPVATFDFSRREITVAKTSAFRTRIVRTLPFDMVEALDIKPGYGGAALWLKDGTVLKATPPPTEFIQLDRRLADIRARSGIAAAHPAPERTEDNRAMAGAPSGTIVIAAPAQRILGKRLAALPSFFFSWLVLSPILYFWEPAPSAPLWAKIVISLLLVSSSLLLLAIGLSRLFGRIPRLLLDSETREAHFDWEWPCIWPRESIPFDDLISAGAWERVDLRGHGTRAPYIRFKPDRTVMLWDFSDSFSGSAEIAERICRVTGAELRHRNAMKELAESFRGPGHQQSLPRNPE